jgi:hypothetical protein
MEIINKTFLKRSKIDMIFCSDDGVKKKQTSFGMVGSFEGAAAMLASKIIAIQGNNKIKFKRINRCIHAYKQFFCNS